MEKIKELHKTIELITKDLVKRAEVLPLLKELIKRVKDSKKEAHAVAVEVCDKTLLKVKEIADEVKTRKGEKGDKGDSGKDGKDGKDGESIVGPKGDNGINGKDGSPDTADQVRDKLETLTGDERLDKSAIKGLEELEKNLKKSSKGGVTLYGGRGIDLYVDGTFKGQIKYLNFIAGTNMTLTHSTVGERNDITFSSTGSQGSFSVLTVTGTVDDTNKEFTVASEPVLVVINGAAYQATGAAITWTYLAGALTLSEPVGQGGNIYAIA